MFDQLKRLSIQRQPFYYNNSGQLHEKSYEPDAKNISNGNLD